MAILPNSFQFLSRKLSQFVAKTGNGRGTDAPTRQFRASRKGNAIGFAITLAATSLTAASSSAQAADLTVQVGAFGIAPKPAFTKDAADHGEVMVVKGDDGVTRVSIGRFSTKSDARDALARLQIAGYSDAYITNITTGMTAAVRRPTVDMKIDKKTDTRRTEAPVQQAAPPAAASVRTLTKPIGSSASSQRLPGGRQIVQPKQPTADDNSEAAHAGRFRLRTHDTQSGQTKDVELVTPETSARAARPRTPQPSAGVVAGMGANEVPAHLRNKLVYLDGVPHIKEGDKFIPLTDAVGGKP